MTPPSPLPWKIGETNKNYIYGVLSTHRLAETTITPDGEIDKSTAKRNAELIVKSVNLFPRLVDALASEHDAHIAPCREAHVTCAICELLHEARGGK